MLTIIGIIGSILGFLLLSFGILLCIGGIANRNYNSLNMKILIPIGLGIALLGSFMLYYFTDTKQYCKPTKVEYIDKQEYFIVIVDGTVLKETDIRWKNPDNIICIKYYNCFGKPTGEVYYELKATEVQ